MPIDLRATLGFAQWSFGAALLAVATVDYSSYEFALNDLMFYERRLHPPPVDYFPDPWTPSFWRVIAGETARGTPMLACAGLGLAAAAGAWLLARRRRAAALSFALAVACAAAIVGLAAHAVLSLRARALSLLFLERAPGLHLRWQWPDSIYTLEPWDAFAAEQLAAVLSALLLPAVVLAGLRVARHRGWSRAQTWLTAGALGLPALLAAGRLAHLWIHDWHSTNHRSDAFEGWVGAVQTTRSMLLGAAGLVVVAAFLCRVRRPEAPRLLPASGLLALGVAAFLATEPHRGTIDALYPLRDPGQTSQAFYWLSAPWTFDPPRADACTWEPPPVHEAAVRFDDGTVALELDGVRAPLVGATTVEALLVDDRERWSPGGAPRDLALLVDRRVPAAALAPFLAQLPAADIDRVVVQGAFAHEKRWAEGQVSLWTLCDIGVLDDAAFLAESFAPGTAWGDLMDGPSRILWE